MWVLGPASTVSHTTMSQWDDFTVSPAAVSGRLAFDRAGVPPAEIDLAEIYDAFTYMTLVTLEDLGFCAKGEGGAFVEKGRLARRRLPVNTDGGGLSACHPGMRGLFLLVEAVRQLRGEAGGRQVRGPGGGCRNWRSPRAPAAGSVPRGRWCWGGADATPRGVRPRPRRPGMYAARVGGRVGHLPRPPVTGSGLAQARLRPVPP